MAKQDAVLSVPERLDRLPATRAHWYLLLALGVAVFFDQADLSGVSGAAVGLIQWWKISASTVALLVSFTFLGSFVGAVAGGWLGDRWGRKRMIVLLVATVSVGSLVNAVAWNIPVMLACRFVAGIGLAGTTAVGSAWISEFFAPSIRGRFQAAMMVISISGIPAVAWFARLVVPIGPNGWRFVFLYGCVGVVGLVLLWRVSESPRWLATHGHLAEAEAAVDRLETLAVQQTGAPLPPSQTTAATEPASGMIPHLRMLQGPYRKRTVVLGLVWIFQTLGFYGFTSWVGPLLALHGFKVADSLLFASISQLGGPVGILLSLTVIDRFERRWLLGIACGLIMVCGLLYGLTFQVAMIVVFGILTAMFLQSFVPIAYSYTCEQYPTEARASAMGLLYGTGRLANVAGPLIVAAIYASVGYVPVFVYIAASWLITGGVVVLFGVFTTGRTLEHVSPAIMPGRAESSAVTGRVTGVE